MKKIAFLLCLVSGLAVAQTYTDSAGNSVRDKDGQGREGRGTIGAGNAGGTDPLDPGDVEVPDGQTNDQLLDMGLVDASATCEFQSETFSAIPCPDYADGSCNYMGTPDMTAGNAGSAGSANGVSASQLFGTTQVSSDSYTVVVDLKSTTGYKLTVNGQEDSLGGVVNGDEFDGVTFNHTVQSTGVNALNRPVVIVPGSKSDSLRHEPYQQLCSAPYQDEYCYRWNESVVTQGTPSYRVPGSASDIGIGIFNSAPAGELKKMFAIKDFEHVAENGAYTRQLNIVAEVLFTSQGDSQFESFYGTESATELQIRQSDSWIHDGYVEREATQIHDQGATEPLTVNVRSYRREQQPLSPYNTPSASVGGEPAIVTASCTFNGPEAPVDNDWDTVPPGFRDYCEANNIPPENCDCDIWYARGLECGV